VDEALWAEIKEKTATLGEDEYTFVSSSPPHDECRNHPQIQLAAPGELHAYYEKCKHEYAASRHAKDEEAWEATKTFLAQDEEFQKKECQNGESREENAKKANTKTRRMDLERESRKQPKNGAATLYSIFSNDSQKDKENKSTQVVSTNTNYKHKHRTSTIHRQTSSLSNSSSIPASRKGSMVSLHRPRGKNTPAASGTTITPLRTRKQRHPLPPPLTTAALPWSCPKCTYVNWTSSAICSMCESIVKRQEIHGSTKTMHDRKAYV
jgi:hypothetical protein